MRRAWLALTFAVVVSGATARARPSKPDAGKQQEEDLATLMARRIQRATGVPVQIRELVYEVFTSTFSGRGIKAGPHARPFLVIPKLKVELSLLAKGPGATVSLVRIERPRIRLLPRWITRIYRFPVRRSVTVRVGKLQGGTVTVELGKNNAIRMEGLDVSVNSLKVPTSKAGKPPALTGKLRLWARVVRVGQLELGPLVLEGAFDGKRLEARKLTLGLPGGEVALSGSIGLGGGKRGPGPFELAGSFKAELSTSDGTGALHGRVKLTGASLDRLAVGGKLEGKGLPRRGGIIGAPALDLRLRAGKRRLRGSLRSWRVR